MTPLHEQARALAEAGIKVFPCHENGKTPATEHGFKDASSDLAVIDAWWTENPNYNIGLSPEDAGWAVIDIDPGGEASWIEALKDSEGYEPTYEVTTPRGGRHIYFTGSLPSTAGKIGSHVDTRGVGGYVLVPPSVVNGKAYEVAYDRPIVELPRWIESCLAAKSSAVEGGTAIALDAPANVARGRDYLRDLAERGDIAVSGRGGNLRTYRVFAFLKSMGISQQVSLGLVLEPGGWNDHCIPPWSPSEIETPATNAYKYGQNVPGTDGVEGTAVDSFGNTEAFREAMKAANKAQSRYRVRTAKDFDEQPEPTWIVKDLIPADSIVLWIGPPQSFKSFLLLDVMLGVAAGKLTFGDVPEAGAVLYGAREDLLNIGKGRRRAWQTAREITDDPMANFGGSDVPILGMPNDFTEWLAQIKTWLGTRKLKMIAIDTAGKTLGPLSENDSSTVRVFYQMCERLQEEFGCTVIAVHHSGKNSENGARGSSAWLGDFDSVIETIRPDKSLLNVEVVVRKHKNSEDGKRWTFKGNKLAGSLVFSPSTPAEHKEAEENSDFFAPSKIGRALIAAGATEARKKITTTELWNKLGGALGDETGVRKLEKLSKNVLRAYCDNDDGILYWWYNPVPGGTA